MLDGIGTQVFAPSADPGIYRYYDSEDCVRKEASASGVNYAEEFKYHPGSRGQRIYASCLDGEI
jgi:hypothetical protein